MDEQKEIETAKTLILALRKEFTNSLDALTSNLNENVKTNEAKVYQASKLVTDLEARIEKQIEAIDNRIQQINTQVTGNVTALRESQERQQKYRLEADKVIADLKNLIERVNGSSIPGIEGKNIEQLRASLERIESQLNGEGGRLTFTQLVARAESAQTLSSTFWKVTGAVGFTTIAAAGAVLFGFNKTPDNSATVNDLNSKVANQAKQIEGQAKELGYLRDQVDKLRDKK